MQMRRIFRELQHLRHLAASAPTKEEARRHRQTACDVWNTHAESLFRKWEQFDRGSDKENLAPTPASCITILHEIAQLGILLSSSDKHRLHAVIRQHGLEALHPKDLVLYFFCCALSAEEGATLSDIISILSPKIDLLGPMEVLTCAMALQHMKGFYVHTAFYASVCQRSIDLCEILRPDLFFKLLLALQGYSPTLDSDTAGLWLELVPIFVARCLPTLSTPETVQLMGAMSGDSRHVRGGVPEKVWDACAAHLAAQKRSPYGLVAAELLVVVHSNRNANHALWRRRQGLLKCCLTGAVCQSLAQCQALCSLAERLRQEGKISDLDWTAVRPKLMQAVAEATGVGDRKKTDLKEVLMRA